MNDHPSLSEAFAASTWLSDQFQRHLTETAELTYTDRIAVAFLSLCLDHREAVLLLVQRGARASAMSLARSAVEAYVLALWAQCVPTEQDLQTRIFGPYPNLPKFDTAFRSIKQKHPLGKFFSGLADMHATLSDYSHGHARQISRWFGSSGVGPIHGEAEVVELLHAVDKIGTWACAVREDIAGHDTSQFQILLEQVASGAYYAASQH